MQTPDPRKITLTPGIVVDKDSPRVAAIIAIDELTAHIGLALAYEPPEAIRDCLETARQLLETADQQLRAPGSPLVTTYHVESIDALIRNVRNGDVTSPRSARVAASCNLARAVCRRAEFCVVANDAIDPKQDGDLVAFFERLTKLFETVSGSMRRP